MLDYITLAGKKRIKCNNKEYSSDKYQTDLLTKVIDNVAVRADDILIVNEYYVGRPDLISLAVYNNDKYADLICKYNGISNPFEMNENDVIYLPDHSDFKDMIVENPLPSELVEDNETMITKEFPLQKEKDETRSPAEQVVGERNFVIDKSLGVVFY